MAEESASAATEAVRTVIDLSLSFSDTGCSISLKIDNPIIAGVFTVGALSLGAYYLANRRPVESALRNALEFRNEAGVVDPEVRNIEEGSILVELHCHSENSFLQFVEDFEAGKLKHRLEEEFTKIGFQRKLIVTIRNADEVYKKLKVIRLSHKESKTEKLEDDRVHKIVSSGGSQASSTCEKVILDTYLRHGKISFAKKDIVKWDGKWQPPKKEKRKLEEEWRSVRVAKLTMSVGENGKLQKIEVRPLTVWDYCSIS